MKKAQAQHIFMFVIGLVIISLVLLFGYNTITDLNNDRCLTQEVQFGTQLLNALERNKQWGTSNIETLQAPCEATHVCFVDRDLIDNQDPITEEQRNDFSAILTPTQKQIIARSIDSNDAGEGRGDQTNVFYIAGQSSLLPVDRFSDAAAPIESPGIDPTVNCVEVQMGNLRVRMEGSGQRASVTEVVIGESQ